MPPRQPAAVIAAALDGEDVSPEDLRAALDEAGVIGVPSKTPPRNSKAPRAKPLKITREPAADELAVANIGARTFKKPGPRIINAKTGEPIEPERLAKGLIAAAVLEHARVDTKADALRMCECGKPMALTPKQGRRTWCAECGQVRRREKARRLDTSPKRRQRNRERMYRARASDPEKHRAQVMDWKKRNAEKVREQKKRACARKKAEREALANHTTE